MKLFKNTYIRFLEYNTFSVCAFKPNFAYSVCAFKPKFAHSAFRYIRLLEYNTFSVCASMPNFAHTIRAFKPKLAHVPIGFSIDNVISTSMFYIRGR